MNKSISCPLYADYLSSVQLDPHLQDRNLSQLLYSFSGSSPSPAVRAIRGSGSSYSGGTADTGSPTLEQAILMGCRDFRSPSPDSDTSGVGTITGSEGSMLSELMVRAQAASRAVLGYI